LIIKINGFYYDYCPTDKEEALGGESPLVKFGGDFPGDIYFDND
jgi:hypothetical protein